MEDKTKDAIKAVASMIDRSEKAQGKFSQGTSQYTLQKNRIKALNIAKALLEKELGVNEKVNEFSKDDLKNALAPINSLMRKSEKAQTKLAEGTWQLKMLESNLKALHMALPLLKNALSDYENKCEEFIPHHDE